MLNEMTAIQVDSKKVDNQKVQSGLRDNGKKCIRTTEGVTMNQENETEIKYGKEIKLHPHTNGDHVSMRSKVKMEGEEQFPYCTSTEGDCIRCMDHVGEYLQLLFLLEDEETATDDTSFDAASEGCRFSVWV